MQSEKTDSINNTCSMKKSRLLCVILFFSGGTCFSQDIRSNTLLWRIDGKMNENPSYLFGTLHLPQRKFIEYTDSVYAAIQATKAFYTEIDFLNGNIFTDDSMMEFLKEKEKHFLAIRETEGWKRMIDRINKKYGETLAYDSTEQFIAFGQRFMSSLYEPEEGVSVPDVMLATHALTLGKKTGGLETYKLQLNMLYEIIDARLADTSIGFEDEADLLQSMKRLYVNQQFDSMSLFIEKMNPLYKSIVFDNRNRTMADSIQKHMTSQPSFFAVGAGHLVGSKGVIALLRQKGFSVTPVFSTNKISLLIINNMMKQYVTNQKQYDTNKKWKDAPAGERIEETRIDVAEEPPPPPPPPAKNSKPKLVPPRKNK
jgi:uncharacterized protein YbaP (TraB family)